MSRLTITLSQARCRALKEASAQRAKTIGQLIDESLDFYGSADFLPSVPSRQRVWPAAMSRCSSARRLWRSGRLWWLRLRRSNSPGAMASTA